MSGTQEYYALSHDRSSAYVRSFLNRFLPDRTSALYDYPVPEGSDRPCSVLRTESEILEYLEEHPSEPYGLYWNSTSSSGVQAMAFYTVDGKVILGIADWAEDRAERLRELASFANTEFAMLGWEQRPPDNSMEFIEFCKLKLV